MKKGDIVPLMIYKVKILDVFSKDQVKNIIECIKALSGVVSVSREYKKSDKKEKSNAK